MGDAVLVQISANAKRDGQALTAQSLYAKTPVLPVSYASLRTRVRVFQAMKEKTVSRQHVHKSVVMVVIVQLPTRAAVYLGGLIPTVLHPFVSRLVGTAETAQDQIRARVLLIGLDLIVEHQCANRPAIMELVVLRPILVCARQAGVATIVRGLYAIKDSLLLITNCKIPWRLHI